MQKVIKNYNSHDKSQLKKGVYFEWKWAFSDQILWKTLNKSKEGKSTNNICKFEKVYFLQVWETFYLNDYVSI